MEVIKLTFNNSEGSILELDKEKNELRFFRDPWGRDSSSIPDQVFSFDQLNESHEFICLCKLELSETDYNRLLKILQV